MKNFRFEEKVLSPWFGVCFVFAAMLIYYVVCGIFSLKFGFFDIEEIGVTEVLTYLFYGFAAGVAFCCRNDFLNTPKQNTFFALMFLWTAALFREMGIQHWLTTHDTVITKSRFFTNPANPLYEKIIAGTLMILVIAVFAWVVIKYLKKIFVGLIKFETIPCTFWTFTILAIVTQIVDRFPANYLKATGVMLDAPIAFVCKIFEEGGESLLPLLFALALLQYHYTVRNKS